MNKKIMPLTFLVSFTTLWGYEACKGLGKDTENTGKNTQEMVKKNQ